MMIGVDYASVDGNAPPNWATVKAKASFVILRAAYGTYQDPTFKRDWTDIARAGLTRGAYLFLRYGTGAPSPEDQVGAFVEAVGQLSKHDFVPSLDVEFPKGVAGTGLSISQAIDWTQRAWAALVRAYNTPPMVYTSARVWSEDLGNPSIPAMAESPPWLAKPWPWMVRTVARINPDDLKLLGSGKYDPKVPPMWNGIWWIHQYQGDAVYFPGFSSTVDVNRFHEMRPGEIGARVSWMQRRIGRKQTGVYAADDVAAVKALQTKNGLIADAIIGVKTFAVISWCDGVEDVPEPSFLK